MEGLPNEEVEERSQGAALPHSRLEGDRAGEVAID